MQIVRKFLSAVRYPKYLIWRLLMRFRKFLASYGIPSIPEPPVWQFPDGLTVHSIDRTGIVVVDHFLSDNEARKLIDTYGGLVQRSSVIGPGSESITHDYRTSSNCFIPIDSDSLVGRIAFRAANLLGLPIEHVESFSLTRYQHGEYYKSHYDHDGSMKADRLYTILIYLNDLNEEQGGGTLFNRLNLIFHPVGGRAVIWRNSNLNGLALPETEHSALPVLGEDAEKWVAQLWFRAYKFSGSNLKSTKRIDGPEGVPFVGQPRLLRGLSTPSD